MKKSLFFKFILLFVFVLFLENSFTQDLPQSHLPEGAKARIGNGNIWDIGFSPDGNTLVSTGRDAPLHIWAANTGAHVRALTKDIPGVPDAVFSPDGNTIVSWVPFTGNTIHLWDANTGKLIHRLTGHTHPVYKVAFSPDGNTLASTSWDRTIRLWNTNTGKLIHTLTVEYRSITAAFSPDGNMLVSWASKGFTVRLWDTNTGKLIHTLTENVGFTSVAFSPDGNTIATGYLTGLIRLWDANKGRPIRALAGYTFWVGNVRFSPDGNTLVSGSRDNTLRLWDAKTGKPKGTAIKHPYWVSVVAFSPDGNTIASGQWEFDHTRWDGTVFLWDVKTGKLKRKFTGHTDWVRSLAFSPDGSRLVSRSNDRTALLWELAPAKQVLVAASQRPPMYWVNTQTGTLHRLVGEKIENLVPSVKNATNLVVDTINDKFYWTTKINKRSGKIQRANLDGSNVQLVKNLTSVPLDIALDITNRKLYLTNNWGKLQRLNLDGSGFQPNLITELQAPNHLALDVKRNKVYWTEQTGNTTGKIRCANLDGSNVQLVKNLTSVPQGVALDTANRKIYLTNSWGKVQRMNFNGSRFQPNLITSLDAPREITMDTIGRKLYWTESGRIRRANFNGKNIQDLVTHIGTPADLALGVMSIDSATAAPAMIVAPEQTLLLSNYPNPFNPETWIPYQLSEDTRVSVSIYDTTGKLVRTLSLGFQSADFYNSQGRAAYWDGRNAVGERVASGVYFYQLTTPSFQQTRRLVIVK